MVINMFDIFYADLSKNLVGSEQGGIRPVIIIQNDIGNKFCPTVLVLPITSVVKKENMPTHCILHKSNKNGLSVDSMVLAEQIKSIDKSRLKNRIGYLDNIKEQDDVLKSYLANITGKKKYNSIWSRVVSMILRLVKEGEYENAV